MIRFNNNIQNNSKLINLLLWLPVINIIAGIAASDNIGFGSFHLGYVRGIVLTLICLIVLLNLKSNNLFKFITTSMLLLFLLLCILSRSPAQSLIIFNKFFISTSMFFIGFLVIRNADDFKKLIRSVVFMMFIIIGYIGLANIFNIGKAGYGGKGIMFGGQGVNIVKILAVALVIIPISLRLFKKSKFNVLTIVCALLSILLIILSFKRGAVLAASTGLFFYSVFTPYKGKIMKLLPILFLIMIPITLYFSTTINELYDYRVHKLGGDGLIRPLESGEGTEGRMQEIYYVLENFTTGDLSYQLFGEDPFLANINSLGILGHYRMNHVDFTIALDSFGIIGFTLISSWYLIILKNVFRLRRKVKYTYDKELVALVLGLFAAHIPLSISNTFIAIEVRGLILMLMGASIAMIIKTRKPKIEIT